jgi:hypothetical protein
LAKKIAISESENALKFMLNRPTTISNTAQYAIDSIAKARRIDHAKVTVAIWLALLGAILAAQRIVKFGRKCGHSREQTHEPLAG